MESEAKQIRLSLKRKWFDLTASGIKTEDYRKITRHWSKRLIDNLTDVLLTRKSSFLGFISDEDAYKFIINNKDYIGFKELEINMMTLGYPSKDDESRILRFKHAGIEIRTGDPEWGAEPNELYFVIKHGARI